MAFSVLEFWGIGVVLCGKHPPSSVCRVKASLGLFLNLGQNRGSYSYKIIFVDKNSVHDTGQQLKE